MRYVSTRGRTDPVSLRKAVLGGTAPDRGLYMPESLEPLPDGCFDDLRRMSFVEQSVVLARHFLKGDISDSEIEQIVTESFDFPVPLVPIEDNVNVLELFHGPTLAFKDFGARFLARLTSVLMDRSDPKLTVLVATSGDTGSAIAHAFYQIEQIRVVVLFPFRQVSVRQQKQFTTLGENITAVAIDGTFDDCQTLVKKAFADRSLLERCPLASANSVNIGRLIPQMFYYFHAVAQLPDNTGEILITTPSGNFGNLTAGLIAKRIGLRCDRFVAATNINDVVPRYLRTGRYLPGDSQRTISNAMDVGHPSNFERITYLYGNDLDAVRKDILGFSIGDAQTRRTIAEVHQRTGYVLDPHSAVGYLGLQSGLLVHPGATGLSLSTAHPAKFPETVEFEIGSQVPIPAQLRQCLDRPERVTRLPADWPSLREFLLNLG